MRTRSIKVKVNDQVDKKAVKADKKVKVDDQVDQKVKVDDLPCVQPYGLIWRAWRERGERPRLRMAEQ